MLKKAPQTSLSLALLEIECEMLPMLMGLWPQLVVLFWNIVEPLGGRALLEDVGDWGWSLLLYNLALLPFLPLGSMRVSEM